MNKFDAIVEKNFKPRQKWRETRRSVVSIVAGDFWNFNCHMNGE